MSVKANYFKIGLFVIVATILLIAAVVFWGASALRQKKYLVETYMNESVKGLTAGSMVYYQGIHVGSVDSITTAPAVYDVKPGTEYGKYIVIRIALTSERITSREDPDQYFKDMVKQGLCFQMKSSPLTGVGYLEAAIYEDNKNPEDWDAWEPEYPYIPSVPSLMSALSDSAETVFKNLAALDFKSLLDNTNTLLLDLDKAVKDLQVAAIRSNMQKLLGNADATIVQLKSLVRSTETAKPPVTVEEIMVNLNNSVGALQQTIKDADVKGISDKSQNLLTELRQSNKQVQSLLRSTDQAKPLSNIEEILADLDETIRQINLLIKQQYPNIDIAIQNVVETSKNLKEGTADIKNQPQKSTQ
jgi:phospholipid/cholesterol/gamma-HCH transport system substrate-binding protein/paraquat-inducible protein B